MVQQIDHDAGDVTRRKLPTLFVAGRIAAKFCVHRSGHNVADLDVVVTHFLHQGFAKAVESKLRGIVSGHLRMRIHSGQRRDVDDVTAAASLHLRDRFMATMENAKYIRLQHRAKILRCSVLDLLESADSGVVDQNVEPAEFFDRVIDQRSNLVVVSHVADETDCPAFIALIELFDGLVNLALMSGSDADGDTFTSQGFGDRAANAFRTAGDDCVFCL